MICRLVEVLIWNRAGQVLGRLDFFQVNSEEDLDWTK